MTFEELKKANESLNMIDVKGNDYAQAKERIKVFRMLFPNGCISTEIVSNQNGVCIMKASAFDEEGNLLGTGTAYEKEGANFINKTSYIENCETSCVARALGMIGIGIDSSFACAEEVQNANLQRDEKKKKKEQPKEQSNPLLNTNSYASREKLEGLSEWMMVKNIDKEKVMKAYKIKNFYEMEQTTFEKIREDVKNGTIQREYTKPI